MWLKVVYDDSSNDSSELNKISVEISTSITAPIEENNKSFRISPIFPLVDEGETSIPSVENTNIYFFNFSNAYRVLGRINTLASEGIKKRVYFSVGLSSIILITTNIKELDSFKELAQYPEYASEQWTVRQFEIVKIKHHIASKENSLEFSLKISSYENLPLTERALIDEFNVSIRYLLLKMQYHMPLELSKFKRLVGEVNVFIDELVYLIDCSGDIPETLNEFTQAELQDKKLNNLLKNQSLDRIIQINSALSYVSTQAFSGAIPILERRSLVRRNSLLGVGSAILALNNIARFIEDSFSKIGFDEIIIDLMSVAKPLSGIDDLPQYSLSNWHESSVNKLSKDIKSNNSYYKLPYFNGRLGFRETEYSIAAAIQSVTSGASLEWSLMTVTHEMLHGHVRNIITSVFYGDNSISAESQRKTFYDNFRLKMLKKKNDEYLIDSIRSLIFTYCCLTVTHGSITSKVISNGKKFEVDVPNEQELWNIFEQENRNINEIFVHVLDLHYFYASRVSAYIPLIWCSWVAVPHLNGDIRQYILRSLLTISSKESGSAYVRFNLSVSRLKELLTKYKDNKLNHPVIIDVINLLNDTDKIMKEYFLAFKSSLIIVDMIANIFISTTVRSTIFDDDFVKWESNEEDEDNFEDVFKYGLSEGFNDDIIKSPISYLLDRMIKQLNSEAPLEDIERDTVLQFMALNSNI